jgi:hypothetical protein
MEKPLIEKLGIKKGSKVILISPKFSPNKDLAFMGNIGLVTTPKGLRKAQDKFDTVLFWLESEKDFVGVLADLKNCIKPGGSIWIILNKDTTLPKEKTHNISEKYITKAGQQARLILNKTTSISNTEYAVKLTTSKPPENK